MHLENNFKFFAPIEFIKGGDSSNSVMKMGGIASTNSEDSDGENLDPSGFETEYFLKYGFMNWNHQTNANPLSIIGKPTKAELVKGKLELECELFNNHPLAEEVYKLAEILKNHNHNLGFSIEGKVLERDPKDKKKITKARITGCAITPNPKNRDAIADVIKSTQGIDIIKGLYSAYDDASDEEKEKAMEAGSMSGQAISKESLKKDLVDITKPEKEKKMKKAEVIEMLVEKFPNSSAKQVSQVYNIIETIQKQKQMEDLNDVSITDEAIEKAYKSLGLSFSKGEEDETSSTEGDDLESTEGEGEGNDDSNNSEEEEEESNDDDNEDDDLEKSMIFKGEKYQIEEDLFIKDGKKFKFENMNMVEVEETPIKKGESTDDDFLGGEELVSKFSQIIKGQFDTVKKDNDRKFKSLGLLNKSLTNQLGDALERLEKIEKTPLLSRTVTKAGYLKKSEDNDLGNQEKILSLSRNKSQILNILDEKAGIQKGEITDMGLANAVCLFESTGTINSKIKDILEKEGYSLTR